MAFHDHLGLSVQCLTMSPEQQLQFTINWRLSQVQFIIFHSIYTQSGKFVVLPFC